MKKNIDILFERLKIEYDVRDQLWVDVRNAVDEIGILLVYNVMRNWLRPTVAPAIEQLKDTPASIERTIVKLEKKSESLEKHKDKDKDISSLAKELWKKIIWTFLLTTEGLGAFLCFLSLFCFIWVFLLFFKFLVFCLPCIPLYGQFRRAYSEFHYRLLRAVTTWPRL